MNRTFSREEVIARERSISDSQTVQRAKKAVALELEKRKALDLPIAVFDKKTRKVYACYPDGTRVEMEEFDIQRTEQ